MQQFFITLLTLFMALTSHAQTPTVVFAGNSIADFWPESDPTFFTRNGFVNTGISGETSRQILRRFPSTVLAMHPDVVVILSPTTNDIARNEGPVTDAVMIGHITRMIELSQQAGAKVILTSNLPSNRFFWRPKMRPGAEIKRVNRLMQAEAERLGAVWVDLHTPLATPDGALPAKYSDDGCHPNAAGYKAMEAILLPAIRAAIAAE